MYSSRMVKNMGSRAKKVGLNLKLLSLNQTLLGLGSKCKNIFLLCKQIWYVPFFWSLTWFSYWIIREILFLNRPLLQVTSLNFIGAGVSISVLILATPRLGTTIRQKCINFGVRTGINIKKAFTRKNFHTKSDSKSIPYFKIKKNIAGIQVETSKPLKPHIQYPSLSEKNEREASEQVEARSQLLERAYPGSVSNSEQKNIESIQVETSKPQKPVIQRTSFVGKNERDTLEQVEVKSQLGARAYSGSVSNSERRQTSQEIASECLTCANLISCKHRRTDSVGSQFRDVGCPLVKQLTSNRNDIV
jgi:hypothetical protein